MSRANKYAARVALASRALDGYSGPLDIVNYRSSWWRRLLRRPARVVRVRVFVDVHGNNARMWHRDGRLEIDDRRTASTGETEAA